MPHITIQSPCTTLIDSTHYYTKRNYILCSYNLCKKTPFPLVETPTCGLLAEIAIFQSRTGYIIYKSAVSKPC